MTETGTYDVDKALVVVPTYNEAESIQSVVHRLFAHSPDGVELLVVDDNSPDGTAWTVKAMQADDHRIHLLERPARAGLGSAYVDGFRWALDRGYDAVVEMDADASHDPADVPRLLDALRSSDMSLGSRYVAGGRIENWGTLRRLLSRGGNLYARAWLGFGIKDSTSGFRAYRASALTHVDLGHIRSDGYAFQIEMARRLHRAGLIVKEIPITFVDRTSGRSKMSRRIVLEALFWVAAWGVRDRLAALRRRAAGRRRV